MQGPRMPPCSCDVKVDHAACAKLAMNHNADDRLCCMDCDKQVATFKTPPGGLVAAVIICPECYERRAKNEATVLTRILDTSPITPDVCRSLGFEQLEADPNIWFLNQGGEILSVVFDNGRAVIPVLDSFTERNAGQLCALVICTSKGIQR